MEPATKAVCITEELTAQEEKAEKTVGSSGGACAIRGLRKDEVKVNKMEPGTKAVSITEELTAQEEKAEKTVGNSGGACAIRVLRKDEVKACIRKASPEGLPVERADIYCMAKCRMCSRPCTLSENHRSRHLCGYHL